MQLEKVDPDFRVLIDLLFFTNRIDIDTSNFATLFAGKDEHHQYFWDRLSRSREIFWEEPFWLDRFAFIIDHFPKKTIQDVENILLSAFRNAVHTSNSLLDNRYVQFIAWVKTKSSKKENLTPIRDFLLSLPYVIPTYKLLDVVKHFVPDIFISTDDYLKVISQKAGVSRNFQVIQELERLGIKVDKQPIFKMSRDLLFKRVPNRPNRRSFFSMLNDPGVLTNLQSEYKPEHRPRLLALIKECEYKEIEELHLRNIKNLLELDASIAEELMITYADKLYARGYGEKGANVKRLIRVCKTFPQISPKKVLAYLSTNNRMSDIKHIVASFPDLKTLVPFV